jgi:hypothetical protein
MKKALFILMGLPFLFAGTIGQGVPPQKQIDLDTAGLAQMAQIKADSTMWEAVKEVQRITGKKKVVSGHVDIEERPDGTVYAWGGLYTILNGDTIGYTPFKQRIK